MVEYGLLFGVCILLLNLAAYGVLPEWLALALIIVIAAPTLYASWRGAPYIPSTKFSIEQALDLAGFQSGELLIDLGCGDGRAARLARSRGANAIGYELSFFMYSIARLKGGADIRYGDFWKAELSDADVVYCFLTPKAMKRVEDELWPKLKPGCRLVCNTFQLKTLAPDETRGPLFLYRKP